MNVFYVTYPSKRPWCSDFTVENLRKHSQYNVIPTQHNQVLDIDNSIIHYHNIQILSQYRNPLKTLSKLKNNGNRVIAGLRGEKGKQKYDTLLRNVDAVSVGIDRSLYDYAYSLNTNVFTLPPGENPELFKPRKTTKKQVLCWVGRDHKQFKNAELIKQLGQPYNTATYNKYIPHDKLPDFYNESMILVGFSDYEGFWRPCIEASMCGLPVISTNVGVVPHIIDTKYLIPRPAREKIERYKDLINELLEDPDMARVVGLRNRLNALKYSWEKVTPLHDEAWSEVF